MRHNRKKIPTTVRDKELHIGSDIVCSRDTKSSQNNGDIYCPTLTAHSHLHRLERCGTLFGLVLE